jgi:hypothetical protein
MEGQAGHTAGGEERIDQTHIVWKDRQDTLQEERIDQTHTVWKDRQDTLQEERRG